MKKHLITLLLATSTTVLSAFNPMVRNFSKDSYKGGAQTWDIVEGSGGNMYFANNSGVLEFDGRNWSILRMRNFSSVRSLYYDFSERALYAGGTNELGRMSLDEGKHGIVYTSLLDSLGLSVTEIWSIGKTPDGRLCFEDQETSYIIREGGVEISERSVSSKGDIFCTAGNGRFSAQGTTANGVFITDNDTGETFHLTTRNGLQNNTVLSMCFDSSGGLWLGLDRGIDYVMLQYPVYSIFGDTDYTGTGYACAVFEGFLYLGTNTGVYRIRTSLLEGSYTDSDFEAISGISGQVWSLQVLDGRLFCCHDKGIYIIERGRVQAYIQLDGCWKLEPLEDGYPTHMIGSSYTRLFILAKENGSWRFADYLDGLPLAGKSFFRDYDNSIWLGHHVNGLYRFHISPDFKSVTEVERYGIQDGFSSSFSIYPFQYRGDIVFATENGIYRYDGTTRRAEFSAELNAGFPGDDSNSIMFYESPDRRYKYYWSGGEQAIEYPAAQGGRALDRMSLRHFCSERPLGFETTLQIGGHYLIINVENGFYVIDAERLENSANVARNPVYIKSIILPDDGSSVFAGRNSSDSGRTITLHHKQNRLAFSFAAPVFLGNDGSEYSCRLEGYESEFSPWSLSDTREYPRLRHGSYTFRVRSRNRYMPGDVSESSIGIRILRPWYLSWWASLLYLLVLVVNTYLLYSLFLSMSESKARKIAAKEAEEMRRAQIRKDLQTKAEDLAASTMNLQRKNELLQKIASRVDDAIESAKNGDPADVRLRRLRSISELIRENITHDTDWQKFQHNFDLVYDDFLKRLSERYPSLSLSDKRMCAYLRMDLSSKDIAPLLGMTVRSVEMTRYRLRQKLGLSREDNLTDFLQRF